MTVGQIHFLLAVRIFQNHTGVKDHSRKQLLLVACAARIGSTVLVCELGVPFDNIMVPIQHNQAAFLIEPGQKPEHIVVDRLDGAKGTVLP